ncbi:MAG: transposase zinc-binding domain-containing protein, partial [Candidatus Rokuibacteriota bacterium]
MRRTSAASPSRPCSTGPSRRTFRPSSRGRPGRTGRGGCRPSSGASSRPTSGAGSSPTGLLRVRCQRCGETTVVAFSCRGRGFCPSCGGRRMSELAAHLVDRVLPRVPIRQWVFTVPVPVRYQLAFDAGLTRAVLRVFLRTVFGWQRRRATRRGLVEARSGSVTAIQRFGGALNANVHFHALTFDGVYTRATPTARPVFHRLPPPSDADIAALLMVLHRRVRRLLVRRGRLPEDAPGATRSRRRSRCSLTPSRPHCRAGWRSARG